MMEFLGKYSAQIISVCALTFTMWGFYVQRKHNIISVQPYLTTSTNRYIKDGFGYLIVNMENNGLGPAYIKSFQIYCNGKPSEYEKAFEIATNALNCTYQKTELSAGYAIRAGEKFSLFSLKFPCENHQTLLSAEEQLNILDASIDYECAYNKTKTFDTFKK